MRAIDPASSVVGRQQGVVTYPVSTQRWIREGAAMARRDPQGVADSIAALHSAESASLAVVADNLKAEGRRVLEERDDLNKALEQAGFNPTRYLSDRQQGRIDLAIAAALAVVNVALSLFVFLGFGPIWLAPLMALLVLLTAAAVEEFFMAYDRKSAFGEAFFLTLTLVSLGAQFWLGSIRGVLVGALTPADVGPVTHAFAVAAPILRWSLGVLAVIAEVLCGYKFYRARKQLCSPAAKGARAREACDRRLVGLHGAIKGLQAEPEVRRNCREIGAREYLAAAQSAQASYPDRHLARATAGAAIAILVLCLLLFGAAAAFGAEPDGKKPVAILIDLTKSTTDEHFTANRRAVADILAGLESGERVIVLGITDGFGNVPVLMDRTLPGRGYLNLQLQAARETLRAEWLKITETLQPTYLQTDVIGALRMLAGFIGMSGTPMRVFILSDLRQSSRELNFETVERIPVQKAMAGLTRTGGVPALNGSDIFLLGVDPSNKTAAYMADLREFWTEFFSAAGAEVRVFSVMRSVGSQ
jgi:hypothetical protein